MNVNKKYRLKKDLPQRKAGHQLTWDKSIGLYVYDGIPVIVFGSYKHTQGEAKEIVENNPDWFELIPEVSKEWEIIHKATNGEITIVERLSDNEVFTVGDEVECTWPNSRKGTIRKILSWELLSPVDMIAIFERDRSPIQHIKKSNNKESFTWTDELVLAFARFTNSESNTFHGRYADLEEFKTKQSKSPSIPESKEIIEVGFTWYNIGQDETKQLPPFSHLFKTIEKIPEGKFQLIKQAIESVLNYDTHDGKGRGKEWGTAFEQLAYWATHSGWRYCQGKERGKCGNEPIIKLSHLEYMFDKIEKEAAPTYSQQDLDKVREDAFNAAREGDPNGDLDEWRKRSALRYPFATYPTLNDYLKSLTNE